MGGRYTAAVDDPQRRAVINLGLSSGEDEPPPDTQLADALREAAQRNLPIAGVAGVVGGALSEARRGQIIRLFERLQTLELPASVAFIGARPTDPADLTFLGQQARAYSFSITVRHDRIVVITPWMPTGPGTPPA